MFNYDYECKTAYKIAQSEKLSMCHLNIRSLPEHFIEFTAYI